MPNASQSPKPKAPGAHNSNQKKQWGREGEQPARRRPGDGEGEELAMCYDWQILTRLNALFESAAPSASVSGASGKVLAVFCWFTLKWREMGLSCASGHHPR